MPLYRHGQGFTAGRCTRFCQDADKKPMHATIGALSRTRQTLFAFKRHDALLFFFGFCFAPLPQSATGDCPDARVRRRLIQTSRAGMIAVATARPVFSRLDASRRRARWRFAAIYRWIRSARAACHFDAFSRGDTAIAALKRFGAGHRLPSRIPR